MIRHFDIADWSPAVTESERGEITSTLEQGGVAYLPRLAFQFGDSERRLLSPAWSDGKSKNIYLRGAGRELRGARGEPDVLQDLRVLIDRFAAQSRSLIVALVPRYAEYMTAGNTSYRPCEVEARAMSWRKDDSRLHTDAFPSSPTHGVRILRVFSNVNPSGEARHWRVGEAFEDMVGKFAPAFKPYSPAYAWLLERLRITKSRMTEYDHQMLQLHDLVKADAAYQEGSPQEHMPFPPGSTWICFSDHVLHAAMSGQYMMEQTFFLPVQGMHSPESSPLRVLERRAGRSLV
jgi:hypothetical protein